MGDFWNDGHISAAISNMNDRPSLLVNQVKNSNHWIGIKTVGTRSNHDGIGARLILRVGNRILADEVRSGSSYISQSDLRVHFGLGNAQKIDGLEIHWPSGLVESYTGLAIDKIADIKEGSGQTVRLRFERN